MPEGILVFGKGSGSVRRAILFEPEMMRITRGITRRPFCLRSPPLSCIYMNRSAITEDFIQ
jgi:hypothetical protein